MPFELIVQAAFTDRLEGGGVRVRQAGDHIADLSEIDALKGKPHVVQIWVDDPPPAPAEPVRPFAAPSTDPAPAPAKA